MWYRVHLARAGFELATLVVLGTDSIGSFTIGSCKTTIRSRPRGTICVGHHYAHYMMSTDPIRLSDLYSCLMADI